MTPIRKAKVLFIDDDPRSVEHFINHLRQEGFTNLVSVTSIQSFYEVVQHEPDLVFLDIAGVASAIDPKEEGLSLLRYLRKEAAWIRIVVLSGSTFPADRAADLALADRCCTKASLSLAELTSLASDELKQALAPEFRNVRILAQIQSQLEKYNLRWWDRRRLDKAIASAMAHEGDDSFDWRDNVDLIRKLLGAVIELAPLLRLLASGA